MAEKRLNSGRVNRKPLEVRYFERCIEELNQKLVEYKNIQLTIDPGKRQNRVRLLELQIVMQQQLDDIRYLKSNAVVEAFKNKRCNKQMFI